MIEAGFTLYCDDQIDERKLSIKRYWQENESSVCNVSPNLRVSPISYPENPLSSPEGNGKGIQGRLAHDRGWNLACSGTTVGRFFTV